MKSVWAKIDWLTVCYEVANEDKQHPQRKIEFLKVCLYAESLEPKIKTTHHCRKKILERIERLADNKLIQRTASAWVWRLMSPVDLVRRKNEIKR
jgi:hypothetical protein